MYFYWIGVRFEDMYDAIKGVSLYGRWVNECFDGPTFLWPYSTFDLPKVPVDQIY